MKKTILAALAAPALLMGLTVGSPAAAQNYRQAPSYSGDAEGQIAYQNYHDGRAAPPRGNAYPPPRGNAYVYNAPRWQHDAPYWNRSARQAAPRGYRWQRYGDRYALIRRSDGAVVQWSR